MKLITILKQMNAKRLRRQMLFKLLNSNIVSENTESSTAIRMADEMLQYIESGKCEKRTLPNGFRYAAMP